VCQRTEQNPALSQSGTSVQQGHHVEEIHHYRDQGLAPAGVPTTKARPANTYAGQQGVRTPRRSAAEPAMNAVTQRPLNRSWLRISAAVLLCACLAFAAAEWLGWPFLVRPLQQQLQSKLGRTVRLQADAGSSGTAAAPARLHFWGGIRLDSPLLEIGAPAWSQKPLLLSARDVEVRLRYGDVWRAYQGQQLVVQSLTASTLTAYLERMANGQASWQMNDSAAAPAGPHVETMSVRSGQLYYSDAPLALSLDAALSLTSTGPTLAADVDKPNQVLHVNATGHYRKDAFGLTLQSTGALPWEAQAAHGTPVDVTLAAQLGRASLNFKGTAQDFLHLNGLNGTFRVQGPSLAAIGSPLGVTLPTTPPVRASGNIQRMGAQWTLALQEAQIGSSQLSGAFAFDTAATPPKLSGRLDGALLKLADLGPAVGTPLATPGAATRRRVLPTRPFDLAALRAMNADVQIAIAQVDANTSLLEPLRPFATHLQLTGGVLTLTDIEARTAQGHLSGTLALDGQQDRAHWVAALRWDGVQLQRWLRQSRGAGLPPYVSGQLQGHATLQGSGRSTAEIMATLQGDIGATVKNGSLSHLLIEAAGLDVAEALGVYLKGDKALVMDCALADLSVDQGALRPRLLVVDTSDSTVWVDGTLSLASESLDLRVVVAPKDFSLLTLRAPLHVAGTFAQPQVSVEKGPIGMKLGSALLLGLVNPLAALLPLVDLGNAQDARASAANCQARMHQKLQRALPALRSPS
jgi:uncharacterized protein involved in outer membrane biogenesis